MHEDTFTDNKKDAVHNDHKVVYALFETVEQVDAAVAELQAARFRNSDISVLMPNRGDTTRFAHEKGTKAPEGASTGATTGVVIGGSLGWLAGIGALAIPGFGPLIAAGPIMAALAGAGVGGTIGGITGALIGFGIPEYEAKRYESYVKNGGLLMSVHADDSEWVERAKDILKDAGAQDISSTSEIKNPSVNQVPPLRPDMHNF